MTARTLECFGGPLDGERRPLEAGKVRMREQCEYGLLNPDHLFPMAVYIVTEHRRWGPIWQFEGVAA